MSDITDFINAQYRRIEEAARAATEGPWTAGSIADDIGAADVLSHSGNVTSAREEPCCSVEDALHIAIHDPAYVLADIESKRRLVDPAEWAGGPETEDAYDHVCRVLAAPFSGEPGYKAEEWAV